MARAGEFTRSAGPGSRCVSLALGGARSPLGETGSCSQGCEEGPIRGMSTRPASFSSPAGLRSHGVLSTTSGLVYRGPTAGVCCLQTAYCWTWAEVSGCLAQSEEANVMDNYSEDTAGPAQLCQRLGAAAVGSALW